MNSDTARIVEQLGYVSKEQVEECLRVSRETSTPLLQVLLNQGLITSAQLAALRGVRMFRDLPKAKLPERIGHYQVLERIGEGGSAVVVKAYDTLLRRMVALKILKEAGALSESACDRFLREARTMARLRHPGIVAVYEAGVDGALRFISMELVEGPTLQDRIENGTLPPREAARILRDVARAIQFAHEHGVVHRDLKPSNVLLAENMQPRVADFGLAKPTEPTHKLTRTGAALGTPHYMAPEQAQRKAVDVRTDVYALGVILYEALAGRVPFHHEDWTELIRMILTEEPTPIAGVPRDLLRIVFKAMSKEPGVRYQTAQEFADDLENFLKGLPVRARRRAVIHRAARYLAHHCKIAAVAAVLMSAAFLVTRRAMDVVERMERMEQARLPLDQGRTAARALDAALGRAGATQAEIDGLLAAALGHFKSALDLWPECAEAYLSMGRVHAMVGNYDQALSMFETAIRLDPGLASAHLESASIRCQKYEDLRHLREETAETAALLEQIQRDLASARAGTQKAAELACVDGLLLFARGEYEQAAPRLREFSETTGDARGWYWCGHALFHLDRLDETITLMDEMIRRRPRFAPAYLLRGLALCRRGRIQEAIEDYTRAIGSDPRLTEAYVSRAALRCARGEYHAAQADCTEALRLDPRLVTALNNRATARIGAGDIPGAIEDLDRAIELSSSSSSSKDLFFNRANAHFLARDYSKALADYDRTLELDSENARAWLYRGLTRRKLAGSEDIAMLERAAADLERALAMKGLHAREQRGAQDELSALRRDLQRLRKEF